MKSTVTMPRTAALVIRKPPLFAVFFVLIWATSLWIACHSPVQTDTVEAISVITAP